MLDWREYDRWMSQSLKTLELVDADIAYKGYSWACFKSHQAAEFALKAILYLVGTPAFGHDLTRLLKEAEKTCGAPPRSVRVCASILDKMYIPPRYPDALPEGAPWEHYTLEEAENAKDCAASIIKWVKECASRLKDLQGKEYEEEEGSR
ncbi:MAG: HEPN domain-containing protein [Desulfurococcales archaeon]|nr:HEPN domain-containing protein [Desulfurococcales archaeon]